MVYIYLVICILLTFLSNSHLASQNDVEQDCNFWESNIPDGRPLPAKRLFNSSIIENLMDQVGSRIKDDEIRQIFYNCLPNALDTTVYFHQKLVEPFTKLLLPYTYIITGDLLAMWLRDSTYQIFPYIPLAKSDSALRDLILGVINTQAEMIEIYPYGNAFFPLQHWNSGINLNASIYTKDDVVVPDYPKDKVYEAKYELDSLSAFFHLCTYYTSETEDASYLDNPHWFSAAELILKTMKIQQAGTLEVKGDAPLNFTRPTRTQSETMNLYGIGNPCKRCGLIRTFFRPSDDATIFQYSIPSNALAAVSLEGVAKILNSKKVFPLLAHDLATLAKQVRKAIKKHGIVHHPAFGQVYAFEVDCYGSHLFMDDGNFPSLLSLPKFGFVNSTDQIYQNTRKYILSPDWNPYFAQGKYPGIGSPHTGLQKPWPMAMILRAMTSTNESEITEMLWTLRNTTAGTGFMHESFQVNEPKNYTRAWFTWPNTLFGEFILDIDRNYPQILTMK